MKELPSITFVTRRDATHKPGGDVDLAHAYAQLLRQANIPTNVDYSHLVRPSECSYIVLFNLDQPSEAYQVARECVRCKTPYAIYPLHHKREWTESFLRFGVEGMQGVAARFVGYSASHYETVIGYIRRLVTSRGREMLSLRRCSRMQHFILRNADNIAVSCAAEASHIESDLGVELRKVSVVPHYWTSGSNQSMTAASANLDTDILCAGRIEPRKNQLQLARLIQSNGSRRILFVGKKNLRHAAYVAAFDKTVSACERIQWLDQVSREALYSHIAGCKLYINVSWFEVFSLIDLVAIQMRKRCILSKGSYLCDELSSEPNSELLSFVSPRDLSEVKRLLNRDTHVIHGIAPVTDAISPSPEVIVTRWKTIFGAKA